jgi:hypothetical protein
MQVCYQPWVSCLVISCTNSAPTIIPKLIQDRFYKVDGGLPFNFVGGYRVRSRSLKAKFTCLWKLW